MYSAASSAAASAASEPYFRSHARTYRIKVGDAVTLSCNVENLGEQKQAVVHHSLNNHLHMLAHGCMLVQMGTHGFHVHSLDSIPVS